jgi:hypothetical protein
MTEFLGYRSMEDCIFLASSKGYKALGLQYGKECWTGSTAHLYYNKHGEKDNCEKGKGGDWSNFVYMIDEES